METRRNQITRRLEREGWCLARHGGRHDIFKHPDSIEIISVPRHQTLTLGVARKIAKAAGWTERRKR